MEITLKPSWYNVISVRKSRRQFQPLNKDLINYLQEFCNELNKSIHGVKVVLRTENADEIFQGAIGSYGKIKGATAYAAFVGNKLDKNVQEKIGYIGECFILESTSRAVATCWVGGFFKSETVAKHLNIMDNEVVFAVTPLGHAKEKYSLEEQIMSKIVASHKRKNIEKLYNGLAREEWPDWVSAALEAARLAPSAVNRQPWRFTVSKEAIKVSVDDQKNSYNISKRLDCGISMLHLELGALSKGVKGKWELLEMPDVAVFVKE